MPNDRSMFSLLNLVESIDKITTSAAVCRVGRCEMTAWNRGIMVHIEKLLKHSKSEFAKLMNDCRPINILPPEILTRIFRFAGRGASAINISYVCKWWRQIALASPTLWSLFDPSQKSTCSDLVLGRSKRALLDIRVPSYHWQPSVPSHSWNIGDLSPFRHQIDRLHTFDVMFYTSQWSVEASSLVELFPSAAIRLTRLSLSIHGPIYSPHGEKDSYCLAPLFGSDMPALKVLRLGSICIWPQFSGPALQTLILMHSETPFSSLISILHAVPNLEVLVLENLSFPDAPLGPQRIIMMKHLRMLRIAAKGACGCAYLLHLLSSFSVQDEVITSIDIWDDKYHGWSALETSGLKEYAIADGTRTLYFDESITVSDNRTCFRYSPKGPKRGNNVTITADGIRLLGFFHCRLTHVTRFEWAPTPWSTLVTLNLSMILMSMPSLESLVVVENEATGPGRRRGWVSSAPMWDALLEAEPITYLPRYALRLDKISVSFAKHWESRSRETLIKLLSSRFASGYPIKQLVIINGEATAEEVRQMRQYVQDVSPVWNVQVPSRHEQRISKQLLEMEDSQSVYSEHFDY